MAFTYGDDPSGTPADEVRLLCGDTVDFGDQSLSDNEVAYAITEKTSSLEAAIYCCEILSSKLAKYVDTVNISLSIKASQRSRAFARRAEELRAQRGKESRYKAELSVPGKDQSFVDALNEDDTLVQPIFKVGMDDYEMNLYSDDDQDE